MTDKSEARKRQGESQSNFFLWTNKLASVVFGPAWIRGLFCVSHCWLDNGTVLDALLCYILKFNSTARLQYKNVSLKARGQEHFTETISKMFTRMKDCGQSKCNVG